MARLNAQGFDEVLDCLDTLSAGIGAVADEALDNAAPDMADSLKKGIREAADRGYAKGALADSVVPTKAKKNQYGRFVAVRVVGRDKRGTRNGEKLAYLEYGTSRQAARPVLDKAMRRAEPKCMKKMQETIGKYIDKL